MISLNCFQNDFIELWPKLFYRIFAKMILSNCCQNDFIELLPKWFYRIVAKMISLNCDLDFFSLNADSSMIRWAAKHMMKLFFSLKKHKHEKVKSLAQIFLHFSKTFFTWVNEVSCAYVNSFKFVHCFI